MIWGGVKTVVRGHSLFKQALNEIPEVVASLSFFTVGSVLLFYGTYNMEKNDMKYKRFQSRYTIYRPDDPKAKYVPDIKFSD